MSTTTTASSGGSGGHGDDDGDSAVVAVIVAGGSGKEEARCGPRRFTRPPERVEGPKSAFLFAPDVIFCIEEEVLRVPPRRIVIPIRSGTHDDAYAGLQQRRLYLAH
ncbi:PREDICTED: uncharacterized protein LOC108761414 isoform X2 [Trachymyrmex cornetzi]|uniref:uncharacterized protein LOC108761414 isoform X2 n=1 Tax=Trachymyrmex cornetzi TaxID=471704 RepID=UPI00084F68AE|nr:PREDICTED: uncharacterized protein LOC108761414 isoform X2 [Trachymyrmex cornetzi]